MMWTFTFWKWSLFTFLSFTLAGCLSYVTLNYKVENFLYIVLLISSGAFISYRKLLQDTYNKMYKKGEILFPVHAVLVVTAVIEFLFVFSSLVFLFNRSIFSG